MKSAIEKYHEFSKQLVELLNGGNLAGSAGVGIMVITMPDEEEGGPPFGGAINYIDGVWEADAMLQAAEKVL